VNFTLSRTEEASMNDKFAGPSPGSPDYQCRIQDVIDFWNALSCLEGAGETTPGELEDRQAQVSDYLSRQPIDLAKIERLTAEAAMLLMGRRFF
jgi:hypothetical protein